MPFRLKRIPTGERQEKYRIYAVCSERGDCELEEFLADWPHHNTALLRCIADAARLGPMTLTSSRSHFMDQSNKIYEFIGGRLRVGYFLDSERIVICTHGFLKQSGETPKKEKQTAGKAKRGYFEAKERGDCVFIEPPEGEQ